MSLSMRACTERIACSSVVHCSNSAVSASTRLSIRRTLELFLPRRPRSSSVCSASWRRESPMWRATWFSIRCAPSWTTCSSTWRRCGSSCAPSAASSSGRRLSLSPIVVAVDARGERLPRREREDALHRHAERARGLALLLRDLRLDLLERRERVLERVDLVEDDEARRRVRAEVVAPDREVGLGDAGVGAEDEDGRVRARQQAQRQLGLGADRVQARRVEDDQALLQQRMRVVDEGVAPGRHLDLAFVVARRVVVGRRVVPEAERARLRLGDPFGARHFLQRLRRAGRRRRCRARGGARRAAGRASRRATGLRGASRSAAAAATPARRRASRARPGTSSCGPASPAGCGGRCRRRRSR